jgi:quercetin dioxygenase-like cupin family protein
VDVVRFAEAGYLGPVRVLTGAECRRFLRAVDLRVEPPLDWDKGRAAASRTYYEIATRPEILDPVAELLGGEAILWGATIIARARGAVHAWHSDIESSDPDGRTLSVWIGLEHTTPESSLLLISGSHRFGVTVQQLERQTGKARDETTMEEVVRWAREHDRRSDLVRTSVADGEAVFFDGRLWHASHNRSPRTRRALLLQYAAPDTSIRIPDLTSVRWPFRRLERPLPPCLIVRGTATVGPNRIVPAPVTSRAGQGVQLTSRIHPLRPPLEPDEERGWKPYPAFRGTTANVPSLSCHASVLTPGSSPHPPHTHEEEELLLLLTGEVELVFAEDERSQLRPREFVYYPAGFAHTLRTTSAEPATYVMFKWRGAEGDAGPTLPFARFDTEGDEGRRLFDGSTRYLRKLHSHLTVLDPGGGYEPHVDAYDVAIVVLDGDVETIGGRAAPNDLIFYVAGEPHGMRNVGRTPARYVVFEFHGRTSAVVDAPSAAGALLTKLTDRRRWRLKLAELRRSVRRP